MSGEAPSALGPNAYGVDTASTFQPPVGPPGPGAKAASGRPGRNRGHDPVATVEVPDGSGRRLRLVGELGLPIPTQLDVDGRTVLLEPTGSLRSVLYEDVLEAALQIYAPADIISISRLMERGAVIKLELRDVELVSDLINRGLTVEVKGEHVPMKAKRVGEVEFTLLLNFVPRGATLGEMVAMVDGFGLGRLTGLKRPKVHGFATEQLEATIVPDDGVNWATEQAKAERMAVFGGVDRKISFRCKEGPAFCPACRVIGHHPGACQKVKPLTQRRDRKNPWGKVPPQPRAERQAQAEFPELPAPAVPETVAKPTVAPHCPVSVAGASAPEAGATPEPGGPGTSQSQQPSQAKRRAPTPPPLREDEEAPIVPQRVAPPTPPPVPDAEEAMDSAVTLKRDRGSPAEESAKKKAAVPAAEKPCEVVTMPPHSADELSRFFSFKVLRYYGTAEYTHEDKKQRMHVLALPQGEKLSILSYEIMQEAIKKFTPKQIESMSDGMFFDLGLPSVINLPRTSLVRREIDFFKTFLKKDFVETLAIKIGKEHGKEFDIGVKDVLSVSPELPEGGKMKKKT